MSSAVSLADIMTNSFVVVVFLLLILALKVIVGSEAHDSTRISNLNTSLNMVIFPLLIILLFLIAYVANVVANYAF